MMVHPRDTKDSGFKQMIASKKMTASKRQQLQRDDSYQRDDCFKAIRKTWFTMMNEYTIIDRDTLWIDIEVCHR
jgi:hypothetical protein